MPFVDFVGFAAAFFTSVALLPQVLKAWKTKSTRDISLNMYLLTSLGISLWLVYGFLISSLPLIAANIVTLILVLSVLFLKLKYG